MQKPKSLARLSLVTEVQESIQELIFQQKLKSGDPLPTEHELAETLGVSRNSLREALKVLEATGIVNIRRGYGMFVGTMSLKGLIQELVFHARLSTATGTKELRDLVELRELLESSLMERAITAQTPAQAVLLEGIMGEMDAEAAAGRYSADADRRFHEALYEPLGNPFISQLLAAFWEVLSLLDVHLPPGKETPIDVAACHRSIVTAMKNSDGSAARQAMAAHFDGIKARLAQVDAEL